MTDILQNNFIPDNLHCESQDDWTLDRTPTTTTTTTTTKKDNLGDVQKTGF